MILQKDVVASAWVQLTTAGQYATAWLDEDNDGAGGTVDVRIYHSDSGAPNVSKATEGKRIFKSNNNNVMILEPDNENDIYYAICKDTGATATLSIDAI